MGTTNKSIDTTRCANWPITCVTAPNSESALGYKEALFLIGSNQSLSLIGLCDA